MKALQGNGLQKKGRHLTGGETNLQSIGTQALQRNEKGHVGFAGEARKEKGWQDGKCSAMTRGMESGKRGGGKKNEGKTKETTAAMDVKKNGKGEGK
jgi:hypothetical protein